MKATIKRPPSRPYRPKEECIEACTRLFAIGLRRSMEREAQEAREKAKSAAS